MICANPQGPADPACNLVCPQAELPFGTAADSASAGAVHSTWSVAGSCLAAEIPPFLSTQLQPLPNSVYISLPINLGIWAGLRLGTHLNIQPFEHFLGPWWTCVTCSDKQRQMLETSPQIPPLCRGQYLEVPFEGAAPTIFIHFHLVADMDLVFLQNSRTFPSTNSLGDHGWSIMRIWEPIFVPHKPQGWFKATKLTGFRYQPSDWIHLWSFEVALDCHNEDSPQYLSKQQLTNLMRVEWLLLLLKWI